MRQINPIAKAWANAEKSDANRAKGWVKRRRRIRAGYDYLEGTHRYERTFSDIGTGEFRVMQGRKAKELNESLFERFLFAVQKNVAGRSLERWKVIERFVQDN
jgi:hypothetical protein